MHGLKAFGTGIMQLELPQATKNFYQQEDLMFKDYRSFFPTGRFLQPATSKRQVIPGKFQPAPLSFKEAIRSPEIIGRAIRENPFTAFVWTPTLAIPETATVRPLAKDIGKGGLQTYLVPGERLIHLNQRNQKK